MTSSLLQAERANLTSAVPICRACGSSAVLDKGSLPNLRPDLFGGQKMSIQLEAGHLWHCQRCDLRFRDPYLGQESLLSLYQEMPSSVWTTSGGERRVWREMLKFRGRREGAENILDIGCFTGDFLAWLPESWQKFGIEPSSAAREIARSRGSQIVADAIGSPVALPVRPGIITMIDVLEHVEEPVEALRYAKELLGDRGLMFIFTGAADATSWKLFGADYWYSALPEHVSFFTRRWFEYAAGELDMRIVEYHRMSSAEPGRGRWCFNLARISLYTLVQRLRRQRWSEERLAAVPLLKRAAHWTSVPWWQEAADHQLVVLAR